MIPKIEFIKGKLLDEQMVYVMVHSKYDLIKNWERAKRMKLTRKQFNDIKSKNNYEKAKEIISKISNLRYKQNKGKINIRKRQYKKDWTKINKIFFKEIEKIIKYKWKYRKYEIVLSLFHQGLAPKGQPWIIVGIEHSPKKCMRIIAHEILLSHLRYVFDKKYKKINQNKLIILSEITANALLGLEPKLKRLWEKLKYDEFLKTYPQLTRLKIKLKDIYLHKKDFKDYLNKAIKIIQKEKIK